MPAGTPPSQTPTSMGFPVAKTIHQRHRGRHRSFGRFYSTPPLPYSRASSPQRPIHRAPGPLDPNSLHKYVKKIHRYQFTSSSLLFHRHCLRRSNGGKRTMVHPENRDQPHTNKKKSHATSRHVSDSTVPFLNTILSINYQITNQKYSQK